MNIPVIETKRLVLREWRNEDLDGYAAMKQDAELSKFIGGVQERNDAWRTLAYVAGHWLLRGFGFWSVVEKASGKAVGYCGPYYPLGWPEPEIGWGIYPGFGGKGFATEAAKASLHFAYQQLKWTTAISLIADENAASKAVAQKLGATPDYKFDYRGYTSTVFRHLSPNQFQLKFKGELECQ
jgi:RimJ/RimL family protein N-acetyltransferase